MPLSTNVFGLRWPSQAARLFPFRTLNGTSFGDWEQTAPRFYALASYEELYVMAGHGGRHLELVHLEDDPCCFAGRDIKSYHEALTPQAAKLGSSVSLTAVAGRRHEINAAAADRLLALVAAQTGLVFESARTASNPCHGDRARRRRLAGPFAHSGGMAWSAGLPDLTARASSMAAPNASQLVLCENGEPVGEANALHEAIRNVGNGRYSHWGEVLYFSTPDNSDPNTNGRTYTVVISKP